MALYDKNGKFMGIKQGGLYSGGVYTGSKQPIQQTQPSQPLSYWQKLKSIAGQNFATESGGVKNFFIGAGKGVLSTLEGMSSLGQQALRGTVGKGIQAITGKPLQPAVHLPTQLIQAQGTIQKVGKTAEQIGEFFIPAGEMVKAEKAITGGIDALKITSAAKTALKLAIKSGIQGVGIGAVSTAQTGSLGQGIKSGLIGGATMGALDVGGKVIGNIAEKIPETAWSAILKRTPAMVAKNPNLPGQIAQEGLTGLTRESLSQKSGEAIQKIELSIADLLKGQTNKISTQTVADRLSVLKNAYTNIPGEESSIQTIDKVSQDLLSKGKELSVQDANQMKRDIYGLINKSYGKGLLEVPAKTESQKVIARGLKEEIEKVIPEVKDLNSKQAIYIQTKNALDKAIARTSGKGIAGLGIGLTDTLLGIGGGLGGLISGGAGGAGLGGLGMIAGKKIIESPGTLSVVSKGTQKMLNYFTGLSPTQQILFYSTIRGIVGKSTQ